jgi:hemerythrin-like domain-containing protein
MNRERVPEGPHPDTRSMLDVHAMFRQEFLLIPGLIVGVPPGDQQRTEVVADHIQFMCTILHAHHTLEDEFLWPKLKNRGAEEVVELALLMEGHHSEIARIIEQLNNELRAWRGSAGSLHGLAFPQTVEALLTALLDHMSLEESRALPAVQRYVTADEWQRMAEAGTRHVSQEELALAVGMITCAKLKSAAPMPLSPFEQQSLEVFLPYAQRVHGRDGHIGVKLWQDR